MRVLGNAEKATELGALLIELGLDLSEEMIYFEHQGNFEKDYKKALETLKLKEAVNLLLLKLDEE